MKPLTEYTYSDNLFEFKVLWPGKGKRFGQKGRITATNFAFLEETPHVLFRGNHLVAGRCPCLVWECLHIDELGTSRLAWLSLLV